MTEFNLSEKIFHGKECMDKELVLSTASVKEFIRLLKYIIQEDSQRGNIPTNLVHLIIDKLAGKSLMEMK